MAEFDTVNTATEKLKSSGLMDDLWPEFAEQTPQPSEAGAPTGEPAQVQASEEEADTETVQADGELVDTDDETGEQEAQMESAEGETQEEPTEGEEVTLDGPLSAEQFAQAFDLDDPGKLRIKTKISGEEGEVTLPELVKSYQIEAVRQRKAQSQAQEERQRVEQWTQRQNELNQSIMAVHSVVGALKQRIEQQYDGEEIARLKEEDPGAYAAKQFDKAKALQELDQAVANAGNYANYIQQQNQQILKQKIDETQKAILGSGPDDTEALIPEWNDEQRYHGESNQIRQYLAGLGYDLSQLVFADPKFVLLVRDAARYKEMLQDKGKRAEALKEKVVKLPKAKIVKPGAKKPRAKPVRKKREDAIRELRNTRNMRDAGKILSDVLPDDYFT